MSKNKGQATVELLIVLVVLFLILTFSVHLYQQQTVSIAGIKEMHEARRTAQLVAENIELALQSPVGSRLRVFIPPAKSTQTISINEGTVIVQSNQTLVSVPITKKGFFVSAFNDGNFIVLERTADGIQIET
jgi:type II secretory pathway pseudopilin PulG